MVHSCSFTVDTFFKAKVSLNTTGVGAWALFFHNRNHAILDDAEGFGSTWLSFSTIDLEVGETSTNIIKTPVNCKFLFVYPMQGLLSQVGQSHNPGECAMI